MSEDWESIRQENRRRFRFGIVRVLLGIALFWFLVSRTDWPLRVQRWLTQRDAIVNAEADEAATPLHEDQNNAIESPVDTRLSGDKQSTPLQLSSEAEHGTPAALPPAPAMQPVLPDLAPDALNLLDPALVQRAKDALQSFRDRLDKLNQDDWLEKYGAGDLAEFQRGLQLVDPESQPEALLALVMQFRGLLDKALPHYHFRELEHVCDTASTAEMIDALLGYRKRFPDEFSPELNKRLGRVSHSEWMALAMKEMLSASPDDGGFCEGWLPISNSWQQVGNEAEARDALRQSREALPRMTQTGQAVQSIYALFQHLGSDKDEFERLLRVALSLGEQIPNASDQASYHANLSSMLRSLGKTKEAEAQLMQALRTVGGDSKSPEAKQQNVLLRAMAASWTGTDEQFTSLLAEFQRLAPANPNLDRFKLPYARIALIGAVAAARRNDEDAYRHFMLHALTVLASCNTQTSPTYFEMAYLAKAQTAGQRWQKAVITANNIPDPNMRTAIIADVLKDAPQVVRSTDARQLLAVNGNVHNSPLAIAAWIDYELRQGTGRLSLVEWGKSLPLASQRAAFFTGLARVADAPVETRSTIANPDAPKLPEHFDSEGLMQFADQLLADIDNSEEAMFARSLIARTWNRLGKSGPYKQSLSQLRESCLEIMDDATTGRTARRSYNGTYSFETDSRRKEAGQRRLLGVCMCLSLLLEFQVEAGDTQGAMQTALDLAYPAAIVSDGSSYNSHFLLQLESVANRWRSKATIHPDWFKPPHDGPKPITKAIIASFSNDVASLRAEFDVIKNARMTESKQTEQLTRVASDLAYCLAKSGDIDEYRRIRRIASTNIEQHSELDANRLLLAMADIEAGELQLAENMIVERTLQHFGGPGRVCCRLALAYVQQGDTKNALRLLDKIPPEHVGWRSDVIEAIAYQQARLLTTDETIEWMNQYDKPAERIAVACGFARGLDE